MTGADRGAVGERGDGGIRVRDGVGLLLYLVVGGALLVLGVGGTHATSAQAKMRASPARPRSPAFALAHSNKPTASGVIVNSTVRTSAPRPR
ncbi:hypothetical protein J2S50_004143 [Streptomyces sp. DSM 40167]|nr:hypothetical protein [Streptomyces sp. DSM 40167]